MSQGYPYLDTKGLEESMFCPSCGVESTNKTKYCKSCGANLNPSGSTIEVHIERPPVAAMTFAIAAFGMIGFIASLLALKILRHLDERILIPIFFSCLMFIFMVLGCLLWQLGRLITAYRDNIKRTIESERTENAIPPQPVPPQRQQPYMPPMREPASGVTEHTTRTFSPSLEE
jgi:hypothetical protein